MNWEIIKAFFQAGLSGIRGVREARKTELEIEKLKSEANARHSFLHDVSVEDIQKYDPRQADLKKKVEHGGTIPFGAPIPEKSSPSIKTLVLLLVLLITVLVFFRWLMLVVD